MHKLCSTHNVTQFLGKTAHRNTINKDIGVLGGLNEESNKTYYNCTYFWLYITHLTDYINQLNLTIRKVEINVPEFRCKAKIILERHLENRNPQVYSWQCEL